MGVGDELGEEELELGKRTGLLLAAGRRRRRRIRQRWHRLFRRLVGRKKKR